MADITLKAFEQLLDTKLDEKLDVKFEPITTKLVAIEETLSHHTKILGDHTNVLDGLARDVRTLLDERMITEHRFERLENWAQQVGPKVGIKLDL